MQELFYTLAIYFQSFAYYFQAGDMRTPAFALLPVCPLPSPSAVVVVGFPCGGRC
mgnify:CR=1